MCALMYIRQENWHDIMHMRTLTQILTQHFLRFFRFSDDRGMKRPRKHKCLSEYLQWWNCFLRRLSFVRRFILLRILWRAPLFKTSVRFYYRKASEELSELDKQINERKEISKKLVGTQDDAICQICQKTKFADGIGEFQEQGPPFRGLRGHVVCRLCPSKKCFNFALDERFFRPQVLLLSIA